MNKKIAVLAGDGIGPEVMEQALLVLDAVGEKFGHVFEKTEGLVGGAAYDEHQVHFPDVTRDLCADSDAILFGSVGGPVAESAAPKWKDCERESILALRKAFQFNANFRPARVYPQLRQSCPLKPELIDQGIDLLVVRELLGDIYFGEHKTEVIDGKRVASDVALYTEDQIRSIAVTAFEAAKKRSSRLTSVGKANVLDTSKLWRDVVNEVATDFPEVQLEHMYVDNACMQIIVNPAQFDVILASNMFGDILSDAAAVLPGSLGLTPSASLNAQGFGLYEPAGGAAPDIAGKGVANPIAQILCVAMMLRYSFGLSAEADAIEGAVSEAFDSGARTGDILSEGFEAIGTAEMGERILSFL